MADKYWLGNVATTGKVDDAANWSPSGNPTGADNIYFTSGAISATSGTLGDVSGNVIVTTGFTGNIGAPGAPLVVGNSNRFVFGGLGQCYISVASGKTITQFQSDRGVSSVTGLGTVTTTYVGDSTVDMTVTVATNVYGLTPVSRITMGTSATAITDAWTYGTMEVESRNMTTVQVIGGGARLVSEGTALVTTGWVLQGGVYNKQSSATDTTFNVSGRGSTITPAGNPNPSSTITTGRVFSGGQIINAATGSTLTVTTTTYIGAQQAGPAS